jgi:RNA polymerase sigma-70 factor (ECF subfamily)
MNSVPSSNGDVGLLEKARGRDPEALAKLYTRYYPKVLKFIHYRMGAQEAEDIAGEVFVKLMRSIDRQVGRFEPWLFRLARNAIIDRVRYQKVRPEDSLEQSEQEFADAKSETVGAKLDVEQALSLVGEEYRELLVLRFIQGMTAAEIGEITGQTPGAVRGMLFRALSKLKSVLDPQEIRS